MPEMMVDTDAFSVEAHDGLATLRFRKAFLNVMLDLHTRGEFLKVVDRLERDPSVSGLVQINDESFSGEDDIRRLMAQLVEEGRRGLSAMHRFARSFFQITSRNIEFDKPVVSGVIGRVTLDELGVALMCDRVFLSDDCLVGNPSLGVGLPAGPILTFILPLVVGPKRAVTLLTSGADLGASEALALGLADAVVPRADLERACREEALRLAELPMPVVSATRELVFSQYGRFEDHVGHSIRMAEGILHSRKR